MKIKTFKRLGLLVQEGFPRMTIIFMIRISLKGIDYTSQGFLFMRNGFKFSWWWIKWTFGVEKTTISLEEMYYWSQLKKVVHNYVRK